jgi:uncharacterized Zn finger protein
MTKDFQASREWWAQRWLDLLDSYRFKKRLERARNYARQGNVKSIEFNSSKVLAYVQGTEPEPYQVSLFLEPFTDEEWGYVIETMSQRAIFASKLLSGEMPPNIEEVFTANGLSLFPLHCLIFKANALVQIKPTPVSTSGRFITSWAIALVKIHLSYFSYAGVLKIRLSPPSASYV